MCWCAHRRVHNLLNRRTKMKTRKNSILAMLLGLLLAVSAAGMAQDPAQGDQSKKTETCCSMDSCCCNNGSCSMKEEGAAKTDGKDAGCCSGDSCDMKMKDKMKNHADDDHQCCACCGESCDMNMKHDATMKHDMKGHKGDCCNVKHKDKAKTKKAA